jgi:hypothetical protein
MQHKILEKKLSIKTLKIHLLGIFMDKFRVFAQTHVMPNRKN